MDADTGNDGNTGADWANAKEHLQAAVDLITGVLTDEVTIHLKSNTTAAYGETVDIYGIHGVGKDARLIIQPEIWTAANYDDDDGDPFNATPGAGTFDITADDKPCVLEKEITIENSRVEFRGMEFRGKLTVQNRSDVVVIYSRFTDDESMAFANSNASLALENCYLNEMPIPVVAYGNSTIALLGSNYIINPFITGVWALLGSTIYVAPWEADPQGFYTLQIKTTPPRKADFAAIKAVAKSYVHIKDADINPWDLSVAKVEVVNDMTTLQPNYYGVVLETASVLQGADNMSFTTKNKKGDYVDMAYEQQIVAGDEQGTIVVS